MDRIFVGWDSSQEIAYDVLEYSIRKHAVWERFEIYPIKLWDMRTRFGFNRDHDPKQSTEFTYTRFLVPFLCDYQGTALFIDSDMIALGNLLEIFDCDMSRHALRVIKHRQDVAVGFKMGSLRRIQEPYPRKNWSSCMLLNCAKLRCWTKEAVERESGAWLHRFESIPDDLIGELDGNQWNILDRYDGNTKLLHYTAGGPWLKGCENHPYGDVWFRAKEEMERERKR